MRVSFLCIASSLLAFAAAQSNPNPFTLPPGFMITAGETTTITWTPTTGGTVSIQLRSGASSNLEQGTTVASHVDNNGKTTITLPASTTRNSDYALEIVSDSNPEDVNYSAPFVVESTNTVESMSSSPSSAAMTSATAAASSATVASTDMTTSATTSAGTSRTTSASTRTTMSTSRGTSTRTGSTGSSTPTSGSTSPLGSAGSTGSASTTSAPSSGGTSLKAQGFLLAALLGAAAAW